MFNISKLPATFQWTAPQSCGLTNYTISGPSSVYNDNSSTVVLPALPLAGNFRAFTGGSTEEFCLQRDGTVIFSYSTGGNGFGSGRLTQDNIFGLSFLRTRFEGQTYGYEFWVRTSNNKIWNLFWYSGGGSNSYQNNFANTPLPGFNCTLYVLRFLFLIAGLLIQKY